MKRYAVYGPGWGGQQLAPEHGLSRGHIAYLGKSLTLARRALRRERADIRRLRRMAHLRDAADTYALYVRDDSTADRWTILQEEKEP